MTDNSAQLVKVTVGQMGEGIGLDAVCVSSLALSISLPAGQGITPTVH
ncbi:hypothetical protein [Chelativorans salis]|uniref:Uncharacterized protein n=1 Tax=Chelativorans salis TaxID=2978478 RepID=A0ABT2LUW4_9HYPH|nr:hypothetical protein [Chelativorans sp. EGI FJ00035]MCT7378323.1 hypothetical protein [Chelativorans sp. EGI FJ00035]